MLSRDVVCTRVVTTVVVTTYPCWFAAVIRTRTHTHTTHTHTHPPTYKLLFTHITVLLMLLVYESIMSWCHFAEWSFAAHLPRANATQQPFLPFASVCWWYSRAVWLLLRSLRESGESGVCQSTCVGCIWSPATRLWCTIAVSDSIKDVRCCGDDVGRRVSSAACSTRWWSQFKSGRWTWLLLSRLASVSVALFDLG